MTKYFVKRLLSILPTLLLVSILIFGLQQLLPGDPAKILAGEEQDPNVIAYLTAKMHLDEPLPIRYGYWVVGVVQGDFGVSQWTFVGTAADGTRIETDGVDIFNFKDGKICLKNAFRKARPNLPAPK